MPPNLPHDFQVMQQAITFSERSHKAVMTHARSLPATPSNPTPSNPPAAHRPTILKDVMATDTKRPHIPKLQLVSTPSHPPWRSMSAREGLHSSSVERLAGTSTSRLSAEHRGVHARGDLRPRTGEMPRPRTTPAERTALHSPGRSGPSAGSAPPANLQAPRDGCESVCLDIVPCRGSYGS